MAYDHAWDQVHETQHWGRWPNEHVIRFVERNYRYDGRAAVKAIDLGAGAGSNTRYLHDSGFDVTPLDGAACAIKRIGYGVVGDLAHLPFADRHFDLAIDVLSIAHNYITEIRKIIGEIRRVLKPGGKFFSVTPSDKCWRGPYEQKGKITFLKEWEIERLFWDFDLKINRAWYTDGPGHTLDHWLISGQKQGA